MGLVRFNVNQSLFFYYETILFYLHGNVMVLIAVSPVGNVMVALIVAFA